MINTHLIPFLEGFFTLAIGVLLNILFNDSPLNFQTFIKLFPFLLGMGSIVGLFVVLVYWVADFFPPVVRIRKKTINYTKSRAWKHYAYKDLEGFEIREVFVDDKLIGNALIIYPKGLFEKVFLIDPAVNINIIDDLLVARLKEYNPELLNSQQ